MKVVIVFASLFVWLVFAPGLQAEGLHVERKRVLRFDPFRAAETQASAPANAASPSARSWNPELRTVLVAGEGSMVNLGGKILSIGEEHAGYRLLAVYPTWAVFEHDGESVEIHLPRTQPADARRDGPQREWRR